MSSRFIEALHDLDGVTLHPGGSSSIFKNLDNQYGIVLPQAHQMLLRESNGIEVYWGYFRLFGLETSEGVDVTKWNRHDCWKFAWKDRYTGHWCFGETAWGDQYAYALESLHGKQSPEVYVLSAFSMTPHLAAPSFTEFLEDEFIRCARTPYDATIERARRNLGPLEADNHDNDDWSHPATGDCLSIMEFIECMLANRRNDGLKSRPRYFRSQSAILVVLAMIGWVGSSRLIQAASQRKRAWY